jgi:hypothetical protein
MADNNKAHGVEPRMENGREGAGEDLMHLDSGLVVPVILLMDNIRTA